MGIQARLINYDIDTRRVYQEIIDALYALGEVGHRYLRHFAQTSGIPESIRESILARLPEADCAQ